MTTTHHGIDLARFSRGQLQELARDISQELEEDKR
jgi:hypothetical protein